MARLADPTPQEVGLRDLPCDADHRTRWLEVLTAHPRLIQRPIITLPDGGAVVARDDATLAAVVERLRGVPSCRGVLSSRRPMWRRGDRRRLLR
ncbi:MAG: hypothetical protein IPL36_14000 [Nigerium sp.]|nr:hypothetical protein [Nigerium sp.]